MDLKKKKALWLVTESLKIILVAGPGLSWSRWIGLAHLWCLHRPLPQKIGLWDHPDTRLGRAAGPI